MIAVRVPIGIATNFWRMFQHEYVNHMSSVTLETVMKMKRISAGYEMSPEMEFDERQLYRIVQDIASLKWTCDVHEAYNPVFEFFRELAAPHIPY